MVELRKRKERVEPPPPPQKRKTAKKVAPKDATKDAPTDAPKTGSKGKTSSKATSKDIKDPKDSEAKVDTTTENQYKPTEDVSKDKAAENVSEDKSMKDASQAKSNENAPENKPGEYASQDKSTGNVPEDQPMEDAPQEKPTENMSEQKYAEDASKDKPAEKPSEEKPTENAPKDKPMDAPQDKPEESASEEKKEAPLKSAPAAGDKIDLEGFGGQVKTNDGTETTLKALVEGSKAGVVLFTYPRASTPGCTRQACHFRDNYEDLTSTGLSIYGLSSDSLNANTNFIKKQNLSYSLLCDQNATLIGALGFKKTPKGTARGVFAIDKEGRVLLSKLGSPEETLAEVKKLVKGE